MSTPAELERNIEACEAMRETLEQHQLRKFVVFHDARFIRKRGRSGFSGSSPGSHHRTYRKTHSDPFFADN